MAHVIPDEDHQEGQYVEEVQKIVDRYLTESAANLAESPASLTAIVAASNYCHNQELAIQCLRYSRHPSAFFSTTTTQLMDSTSPFPFYEFARAALYQDCFQLLQERAKPSEDKGHPGQSPAALFVLGGVVNPGAPGAAFAVVRDEQDQPYVTTIANGGDLWLAHYACAHLYRLDDYGTTVTLAQSSPACFRHIGYPNRATLCQRDVQDIQQVIQRGGLHKNG